MLLGALMKQMKTMGLMSPRPAAPFDGLSIDGMRNKMNNMKTPTWYTHRDASSQHRCNLDSTVRHQVFVIAMDVRGLIRSDFVDRGEVEAE